MRRNRNGALLGGTAAILLVVAGCRSRPPRDVLFVSFDTVRADHLQPYGYERETSPRLATLAAGSWLFEQAFAQDTNTNPSHASVFTGRYPRQHGALKNGTPLAEEQVTLTQVLSGRGWATGAFVGGWPLTADISGLDRGFETYGDEFDGNRRGCRESVDLASDWWRRNANRPRFLFTHFYDAHGPYQPPSELAGLFESDEPGLPPERLPHYQRTATTYAANQPIIGRHELVDAYDASIRVLDRCLERLLEVVDPDSTLIVVFSDHGESLSERYWQFDHGGGVYDEQAHTLLLIHAPGRRPRRVASLVELVDIAPTVLHLLDIAAPVDFIVAGHDLVAVAAKGARRPAVALTSARPVTSRYVDRGYDLTRAKWRIQAIRTDRWKLVLLPGEETDYSEFYDLAADPGETRPISPGERPLAARSLEGIARRYLSLEPATVRMAEPSDEDAEKLRSLGYLN